MKLAQLWIVVYIYDAIGNDDDYDDYDDYDDHDDDDDDDDDDDHEPESFLPPETYSDMVNYVDMDDMEQNEADEDSSEGIIHWLTSEGIIHWLEKPISLAVLLFLFTFIMKLAKRHSEQVTERVGCQVTSMLKAEIHRKALLLASTERLKFSDEHIRNLILIESLRLKSFIQFLPFIIAVPVDVGIGSWIIYQELGRVALGVFLGIVAIAIICLIAIPIPDTETEEDDDKQDNKPDDRKIALDKRAQWEKDLISGLYLYHVADVGIHLFQEYTLSSVMDGSSQWSDRHLLSKTKRGSLSSCTTETYFFVTSLCRGVCHPGILVYSLENPYSRMVYIGSWSPHCFFSHLYRERASTSRSGSHMTP